MRKTGERYKSKHESQEVQLCMVSHHWESKTENSNEITAALGGKYSVPGEGHPSSLPDDTR